MRIVLELFQDIDNKLLDQNSKIGKK